MKPADFTLENVFYPEVSVRANPEFTYESECTSALPQLKIQLFKADGGLFRIALELKKSAENVSDSYEVNALAIGVFKAEKDMPAAKQQSVVMASGPNIVYGALRDHIASITARGPWNEYYLPAIIIDHQDFVTDDDPVDIDELDLE